MPPFSGDFFGLIAGCLFASGWWSWRTWHHAPVSHSLIAILMLWRWVFHTTYYNHTHLGSIHISRFIPIKKNIYIRYSIYIYTHACFTLTSQWSEKSCSYRAMKEIPMPGSDRDGVIFGSTWGAMSASFCPQVVGLFGRSVGGLTMSTKQSQSGMITDDLLKNSFGWHETGNAWVE